MAEEPGPGSWWKTLPGVLTAIAAIITAITGLILALNQVLPRLNPNPASPAASSETVETTRSPSTAKGSAVAPYRVKFPAGTQARVDDLLYEVVGTRVEEYNPGELALKLSIHLTNNRGIAANFWDSSFRLASTAHSGLPSAGSMTSSRPAARGTERSCSWCPPAP